VGRLVFAGFDSPPVLEMMNHEPIPLPPDSKARRRSSTLDPERASPRVAPVKPEEPATVDARDAQKRKVLSAQPWSRILKQLTAIALKRIHGRSVDDAQDLAQSAIADAYESVARGGWDPERGELMSYLVARVITTSGAERRRKRSTCEVWLDEEVEDDDGNQTLGVYEKHLADGKPAPDASVDQLRLTTTFNERLEARLAGDAAALEVVAFMKEGLFMPVDLAAATGKTAAQVPEVKDTVRRIRYHAREIVKELSAQVTMPRAGSRSEQVTQ
jgi:DNA-directed RNA polymerase specialized sigma24 family protein